MALPEGLNDAKPLLARFKKAKERRTTAWDEHFRDCYQHAAPQRETFTDFQQGQKKNTDLYDDTAVIGLQTFANRMQKAVVPPWQQWSILVPGDEELVGSEQISYEGQQMPVADALEKVTDKIFNYIHRSNFSSRVYEAFIDLGISTGTITCEFDHKNDKLVFNTPPLSQLYLAIGPDGEIDDHWREYEVEAGQILGMWPDAQLDTVLLNLIKERPGEKRRIIEGCFRHDNEYYYAVIVEKGKKLIYSQDEGESSPFISFRGMVTPGEAYGRGPIMQVLPSIKTLNVVKEFELTAAAIAASGAWTGKDDGIFNPYTVRIAPGMVIPVGSNDRSNPTLAALPFNFDVKFTQVIGEELTMVINKALFAEPLGQPDDPTKTATEIQYRYQMHLEDAGAYFSRLQVELVEKLMRRVIHVLVEAGKIPALKLDGKELSLKHTSPIAKMMDYEDIQNLQQAIANVAMMGEEMVMVTFDTEKVGEYIARKQGVSPTLYRDENERKKLMEDVMTKLPQIQQMAGGVVE